MAEKIATIEELLGDTIAEVTCYRTPSGSLFTTKEEAVTSIIVTSIIAVACPYGDSKECREYRREGLRCQDCNIENFLRGDTHVAAPRRRSLFKSQRGALISKFDMRTSCRR